MKLKKLRSRVLSIIIILSALFAFYVLISLIGNILKPNNIIVVDAGHGGRDPGATSITNIYEKDINLEIAKKLYQKLKSMNYKVILTRDSDEYVQNSSRANIANRKKARAFISIHCNALDNDNVTNGIQVLYCPNKANETNDWDNKALAQLVLDHLLTSTGATNKGIVERKDLVVLNQARVPAILVECGFITNRKEAELLVDEKYQDIIVNAIAKAIDIYLDSEN